MKKTILLTMCIGAIIISSCDESQPVVVNELDVMKEELLKVANEKYENISFEDRVFQDSERTAVVLNNGAVENIVNLGTTQDTTILLGYYSEKTLSKTSVKTYKYEILKRGKRLSMLTTDGNGRKVAENHFVNTDQTIDPVITSGVACDFSNIIDVCLKKHFCSTEFLQCKANRTCETQFYGVTCCCPNGNECVSIHWIFEPQRILCKFQTVPVDVPVLVAQLYIIER